MTARMTNQAMARKIDKSEAVDISSASMTADGDYILPAVFKEAAENGEMDYCDAVKEHWIWSIGEAMGDSYVNMPDGSVRMLPKGSLLASTTAKFYQAEEKGWRCIWLR